MIAQVQVQIPHPEVRAEMREDPKEAAEAQHEVRGLDQEQERLKLIDRGHAKILFHKLKMLDDKLRDVVAMRAAENKLVSRPLLPCGHALLRCAPVGTRPASPACFLRARLTSPFPRVVPRRSRAERTRP